MSKKFRKNNMDPSQPLRKRLPFTSFKMRQWLFPWNCSNKETFFGTSSKCTMIIISSSFSVTIILLGFHCKEGIHSVLQQ